MIDGTFLRGKHRGILLSAVGKDVNEGNVGFVNMSFMVYIASIPMQSQRCLCHDSGLTE